MKTDEPTTELVEAYYALLKAAANFEPERLRPMLADDLVFEGPIAGRQQVYIYGALDRGPTELIRNFGFSWSLAGRLLTPVLQKLGPEATRRLRDRVGAELKTTFASHHPGELSLAGVLSLDAVARYGRQATGEQYLITPNR